MAPNSAGSVSGYGSTAQIVLGTRLAWELDECHRGAGMWALGVLGPQVMGRIFVACGMDVAEVIPGWRKDNQTNQMTNLEAWEERTSGLMNGDRASGGCDLNGSVFRGGMGVDGGLHGPIGQSPAKAMPWRGQG